MSLKPVGRNQVRLTMFHINIFKGFLLQIIFTCSQRKFASYKNGLRRLELQPD